MPTVFVYEFCCAAGVGGHLGTLGRAMRDAVAADFAAAPGVTVRTLDDAIDEPAQFLQLAAACDTTLVIAPEFDGLLADRCWWVRSLGRTCLNPSAAAVALTSDKFALFHYWQTVRVTTPDTVEASDWDAGRLPAIVKPRHGAGSEHTRLVDTADEFRSAVAGHPDLIAQEYVPGFAASVAFLCGPGQLLPLVPTAQRLTADGRFGYTGGELPLPADLADRVLAVGRAALTGIDGLLGFVGVDVVLGDRKDYALEVNPRLTTSYVGLRALAETNLAAALLDVSAGRPADLRWKPGRVSFTPGGAVDYAA
jgi:hypothetical protein